MAKPLLMSFTKDRIPAKDSTSAFLGVISSQPLVLYYLGTEPSELLTIHRGLEGKPAWILRGQTWVEESWRDAYRWRAHCERSNRRWPNHHYFHLCNSHMSLNVFSQAGLRAYFCHHNGMLDESCYRVINGADKGFNAVYTAQIAGFKRIHLAEAVSRLMIITYGIDDHPRLFKSLKRQLSEATWPNFREGNFYRLDPEEVVRVLNEARVGLMLSAREGGNYATVEYFLCGLPLVTTPSIGGRSEFYDDRYVVVVEPQAERIAAAVCEMIERRVDPHLVRESTIARMEEHRGRFLEILDIICQESGADNSGKEIWDSNFYNKFCKWIPISELLSQVTQ